MARLFQALSGPWHAQSPARELQDRRRDGRTPMTGVSRTPVTSLRRTRLCGLDAISSASIGDELLTEDETDDELHLRGSQEDGMELGAFSIILAVKDLEASRTFYEKFGFKALAENASQNRLVLKNGDHVIGLFQGMFEKNILTFNPGWNSNARKLPAFADVRELQRRLKAQGPPMMTESDESTTGPAGFTTADPDGNPILVDQHV